MPEVLFYFFEIDTNPMIWWFLGLVLYVCVEVSRYIDQGMARSSAIVGVLALLLALGLPDQGSAMSKVQPVAPEVVIGGLPSEAEFLDVATPLVGRWEGKRNTAYLDKIASPAVWTVCCGETRGVKRGDSYTDAQCAAMLGKGLLTYRNGLHDHFFSGDKSQAPDAREGCRLCVAGLQCGHFGRGKIDSGAAFKRWGYCRRMCGVWQVEPIRQEDCAGSG